MSLLGKIVKGVAKVAKAAAPIATKALSATPAGRIVAGVGMVSTALGAAKAVSKAAPALRALPGAGAVVRSLPALRTAGKVAGAAATGYAVYDAAGNLIGTRKKGRRINPMNYKALKRAAKRIKASKKLVKLIESVSGGHRRAPFTKSCGHRGRCGCK